jgi:hypothetical protein
MLCKTLFALAHGGPKQLSERRSPMGKLFDLYVEMVKDGTYEVKVPVAGRAFPHVLPHEFRTKEEAETWVKSPAGCALVQKIRDKYAPQ